MKLRKKEFGTVNRALDHWRLSRMIDQNLARTLGNDLEIISFDWARLARYCFWISIVCIVIAIGALFADQYLRQLFWRIFNAPETVKCLSLAALSAALYWYGIRRRARHPRKIFSTEALFFFAVLATAAAVFEFGHAIAAGPEDFSLLILLSCVIYAILGLVLRSNLIWLFALVSLGSWLGAETGYLSGWGAYYLGMNFPLRFTLFGAVLTAAALAIEHSARFEFFHRTTLAMGLLYLFISLWILSIFGNYGDMDSWYRVKQIELFGWALLFGVVACAAIYHGLRYDNAITKGFGLTFLFLNLYTRYFEYFWNMTHKAIFFGLLGISFWILGRQAEKIWNLGEPPPLPSSPQSRAAGS
jgi:hypothetical protein